MRFTRIILCSLLLCAGINPVFGQWIKVSVFNELPVKSIVVSSLKGEYIIHGDQMPVFELNNEAIYISFFNNHLLLRDSHKAIGNFSSVRFEDGQGAVQRALARLYRADLCLWPGGCHDGGRERQLAL